MTQFRFLLNKWLLSLKQSEKAILKIVWDKMDGLIFNLQKTFKQSIQEIFYNGWNLITSLSFSWWSNLYCLFQCSWFVHNSWEWIKILINPNCALMPCVEIVVSVMFCFWFSNVKVNVNGIMILSCHTIQIILYNVYNWIVVYHEGHHHHLHHQMPHPIFRSLSIHVNHGHLQLFILPFPISSSLHHNKRHDIIVTKIQKRRCFWPICVA